VNAELQPPHLSRALALLAAFAIACGDDDADRKRAAAQMGWVDDTSLNLNGQWVSNDFTCGAARLREFINIEQYERDVTGIKVTGDDCVPAGYVSFEGQLPRTGLTYLDLPVRFPIRGYSGEEGRSDTVAVTASGEALVTAPDVLQLVFSNVSVRLVRSDEDPWASTAADPTTASDESSGGRSGASDDERSDAGAAADEDESESGTEGRRTGRATTDAGARAVGRDAGGATDAEDAEDATDAAVSDAGPDAAVGECPNAFLPGASCDHLEQCGCAEDENCRFDGYDPPSCFPAGTTAEGEACEAPSECARGLICANDLCARMCDDDMDCYQGGCAQAVLDDVEVEGLGFCVDKCDPVLQSSCYVTPTPAGNVCQPCGSTGNCVPAADFASCVNTSSSVLQEPGAACTDRLQCFAGDCNAGRCAPWCRRNLDCDIDEICEFTPELFAEQGDAVGHCTAATASSP
jgi:hypothetical protein